MRARGRAAIFGRMDGPPPAPPATAAAGYDEDFYLWSRDQAGLLRALDPRALPPGLDLEHLAEEVAHLGKSERNAVASHLVRMMEHLLKIASSPNPLPGRHWRREVAAHRQDAARRFTPGMARDLDADELWRDALALARDALDEYGEALAPGLPERCPFGLRELLDKRLDLDAYLARLPTPPRDGGDAPGRRSPP